jgi:putative transposase
LGDFCYAEDMRKTTFANGEYYHIYNRGVDKREVFLDEADYERFLICLREFNRTEAIGSLYEKSLREKKNGSSTPIRGVELPALVEIVSYCLNPNHYHLILKQNSEKGIEKFMQKVGTGYTNYFNKKYKRSGALFQGTFKTIHIDSNDYLLYLSAYINKNHFIHGLGQGDWKYASLLEYKNMQPESLNVCKTELILGQFRNLDEYLDFLDKNALYLKEQKENRKYLLEEF